MDKLLSLLNSLPVEEQRDLARRCGTSVGYLRKAHSAKQLLGAALCVLLENQLSGAVTRQDLRPDDWSLIWPELIEKVNS